MLAPDARKLGQRYVMESGTCMGNLLIAPRAQAEALGQRAVTGLCPDAADVPACLREKTGEELTVWGRTPTRGVGWSPSINPADPLLPEHPATLLRGGAFNQRAQVIVGSAKNEWVWSQSVGQSPVTPTVAVLHSVIDATFGPLAASVKEAYPATDATANDVYVRLMTDYLFRCPARELARIVSDRGTPTYLYSFDEGPAFHSGELPYVFGNADAAAGAPTLVEPVREAVQGYWTSFAADGDPNGGGLATWPRYTTSGDQHIELEAELTVGSGLSRDGCDFWASTTQQ